MSKQPRPARARSSALILGAALAVQATAATAGGFYTPYQSASALGTALAGATARSDDASFFFFNPASIALLERSSVAIDVRGFFPSAQINAANAVSPLGADLTGFGASGEMTNPALAPSAFAALRLTEDLTLGLGFSAPFAVVIETAPTWAGRFHLLKTDMRATNYGAALTYRINPYIAVSAGVQMQHFRGEFDKSELIPTPFGLVEARGWLDGEGTTFGPVAGIMLMPSDATRIGFSYRSSLTHHLDGSAGALLPGLPVEHTWFDAVVPAVWSVGIEHRVDATVRLFAEAQWVQWKQFKGFDIAFASGRPNELRPQSWSDTVLFGVGAGYRIRPGTEITAGVSLDTAVADGSTNTLSPDGRRLLVGVGLNHALTERIRLSLSYAHMFIADAEIEVASLREGSLKGTASSHTDMIGLTARVDW